jgi:uncharacterized protein YlxW (UPF0749 family)
MLNKKMKTFLRIVLPGITLMACASLAAGQETGSNVQQSAATGQNTAEQLRSQLSDVQAKEAELQARERQLDEDLRPENIERSLAGVGTTRPEELREQRRRQLDSEKKKIRNQMDQLAQSRTRLETAIATADAEAYRRSAQINDVNSQPQPVVQPNLKDVKQASTKIAAPKKQRQRRRRARRQ